MKRAVTVNLAPVNSLLVVLGMILVILKLTGDITASWWAVLLPFYVVPLTAFAATILLGLFILLVGALAICFSKRAREEAKVMFKSKLKSKGW